MLFVCSFHLIPSKSFASRSQRKLPSIKYNAIKSKTPKYCPPRHLVASHACRSHSNVLHPHIPSKQKITRRDEK